MPEALISSSNKTERAQELKSKVEKILIENPLDTVVELNGLNREDYSFLREAFNDEKGYELKCIVGLGIGELKYLLRDSVRESYTLHINRRQK